jgi:hypothetical protein
VVQRSGLATTEAVTLGVPKFLLNDFSLDLQVGQLIAQALIVNP